MSPRPAPTRHDLTANRFLDAAAQLIDASLVAQPAHNPPRLRSLHYPAALDWIRVEDVLRLTRRVDSTTASKRALTNRWATKDDFIQDAIVHALLYRDEPGSDRSTREPQLQKVASSNSLSAGLTEMIDDLVQALLAHPRSFLLAHIAPLLPRHPQVAAFVEASSRDAQQAWADDYPKVLDAHGIQLRPDWPPERLTLAIQIILDGTLVRSRIEPHSLPASRWRTGSIYADTVLAVVAGAIDIDADGRTSRQWLDDQIHGGTTVDSNKRLTPLGLNASVNPRP